MDDGETDKAHGIGRDILVSAVQTDTPKVQFMRSGGGDYTTHTPIIVTMNEKSNYVVRRDAI